MPRTPRIQPIYTLYIFVWGSGVRTTRTPRERQPFPHEEAANLTMSQHNLGGYLHTLSGYKAALHTHVVLLNTHFAA